jgi:hypothetical protein
MIRALLLVALAFAGCETPKPKRHHHVRHYHSPTTFPIDEADEPDPPVVATPTPPPTATPSDPLRRRAKELNPKD